MTTFDYDATALSAKALFAQFGRTATLRRPVKGNFDPIEGLESRGSFDDYSVDVVVLPASKGTVEAFDNRVNLQGGASTLERYRFVKIAASGLTIEPANGDVLRIGSDDWFILGSTPVSPGGVPILYNVGVKK